MRGGLGGGQQTVEAGGLIYEMSLTRTGASIITRQY